jgi:hypothetical protein
LAEHPDKAAHKIGPDSSAFRFPLFNLAGTHLAWGNTDGSVTVCNLPEINRKLNEVHLGWQE